MQVSFGKLLEEKRFWMAKKIIHKMLREDPHSHFQTEHPPGWLFYICDTMWLSTHNVHLCTESKKLTPSCIEHFKITHQINLIFCFQLPGSLQIHPVFSYVTNKTFYLEKKYYFLSCLHRNLSLLCLGSLTVVLLTLSSRSSTHDAGAMVSTTLLTGKTMILGASSLILLSSSTSVLR